MTVVLLTPVGLDAEFWPDPERAGPDAVFHVFPGFGGRPRAESQPTMASLAAEVAELGDRLDLIGVSLGGMVAQTVAVEYPERVRSLMSCCTGASVNPEVMTARAERSETGGMEAVLEETLTRWFTPEELAKGPASEGVEYARRTLLALDPAAFADAWRAMAGHDLTDRLGEVRALTTCLAGEDDVVAPVPRVRELADGIPGARLVTAPGPHMLPLERPEGFCQVLGEHLALVVV
jgi:pimeloyl-ACP methyl ester carboxylesterase